MNALLLSLIPLVAFAILDTYTSLNIALIATVILTIIEVIYTLISVGHLDGVSIFSIGLVAVLVGFSYVKKDRLMFRLKPAILKGVLGVYMIVFYAMGRPILLEFAQKYPQLLPANATVILATEQGQQLFKSLSLNMGIALTIFGCIVAYSSVKHNNFWWGVINIVGFFAALLIAMLASF